MAVHAQVTEVVEGLGQGGRPAPLYLLMGDPGVMVQEADRLVEAVQDALGGAVCEVLRDEEALPGRIEEVISTPSLFSQNRVIKVVNPQGSGFSSPSRGRKRGEELPRWVEGLPAQGTVVVVVAPEVDRRSPIFKWAVEHGEVIQPIPKGSRREQEGAVRRLVLSWCQELGVEMEMGALHDLLAMVDPGNLASLRREVEKLALRVQAQGRVRISQADLHEVCVENREEAVYLLTEALGSGRVGPVLEALHRLLGQGVPPLALLNTVATYLRRLLALRSLMDGAGVDGVGSARSFEARVLPLLKEEAGGRLPEPLSSMRPYGLYRLSQAAARFSRQGLVRAVRRLWQCDLDLKGGHPEPALALERFLLEIVAEER